jgi:cytochrome c oxidase subunit III
MNDSIKKSPVVDYYFIAGPSFWPLIGCIGLLCTVLGLVQTLHSSMLGPYLMGAGLIILVVTMFGWFGKVVKENIEGLHSEQMDRTYRWGMLWFIVSEIFLFTVFFMGLFYARFFSITELGDTVGKIATAVWLNKGAMTHQHLWPHFQATWPLLVNPNPELFPGPKGIIDTWGIPALNTLILLSSAVTLTWAHWGFKKDNRRQVIIGLIATIILGCIFEGFQAHEYIHAFTELKLTLKSGIYGSTFYALTGLHALHVSMGVIMLSVILIRILKGHFSRERHFAFEAVAWYWHFVDVVWLFLFVFVYWL